MKLEKESTTCACSSTALYSRGWETSRAGTSTMSQVGGVACPKGMQGGEERLKVIQKTLLPRSK